MAWEVLKRHPKWSAVTKPVSSSDKGDETQENQELDSDVIHGVPDGKHFPMPRFVTPQRGHIGSRGYLEDSLSL